MSLPGLGSVGIYIFINAWNDYLFALTFISSEPLKTMPVGLGTFVVRFAINWNPLMAASVLFTIPSLIFFFAFRKVLTRGMPAGSVKG